MCVPEVQNDIRAAAQADLSGQGGGNRDRHFNAANKTLAIGGGTMPIDLPWQGYNTPMTTPMIAAEAVKSPDTPGDIAELLAAALAARTGM